VGTNLGQLFAQGDESVRDLAKGFNYYLSSAKAGDATAQGSVGYFYFQGMVVDRDYPQAFLWYAASAAQGSALAQASLGFMYLRALGVKRDLVKAHMWFTLAAAQGEPLGTTGCEETRGLLTPDELRCSEDQAKKWHPDPLSRPETESINVRETHDEEDADASSPPTLEGLQPQIELAEKGDVRAQVALGLIFHMGKDGIRDIPRAIRWYEMAAKQGNSDAQVALAIMSGTGDGVPSDTVKAYMWANLAARQGSPEGIKVRDMLAKSLSPRRIKEAEELAATLGVGPKR
jgi:TPR repeat protein